MSSDVLLPRDRHHRLAHHGDRLWASLMDLAQIGATPKGGCRRRPHRPRPPGADKVGWAREAGMSVTIDKIGNVCAGRPQPRPAAHRLRQPYRHQPTGGKFDGNYGVLAALEVVRTLNDLQIATEAPIEVVFWTNEEGRACTGDDGLWGLCRRLPLEETRPSRIKRVSASARRWRRSAILASRPRGPSIGAYFEAHIEQGRFSKMKRNHRYRAGRAGDPLVRLRGHRPASHAGPTPMRLRQDALQVATRIMQEVVAIAGRSEEGRGTVGSVQVWPNSRNVVPGRSPSPLICAISAMRWWTRWIASCGRLSRRLSGRAVCRWP